jgi:hypothetical protein
MKRFYLVLVFCLVLVAVPGQAQSSPTLSSLEISLWPEYDRPDVLVIERGQFAADTPLPVAVEWRIPASVGQPHAVAYVSADGQRLNQDYTTRVEGDWLVVTFDLGTPSFQLEYYTTLPIDATSRREFTFSYIADYALDTLNLEVQVPPAANDFAVEPPADSTIQGTDGLTYQLIAAGPLAQGKSKSWTVTYQKTGSELTVDSFASDQPSTEMATPTAQSSDNSLIIIFAVSFVALIAVGASAFWLGKHTQPASPAVSHSSRGGKRRGGGKKQPPQVARLGNDRVQFCHQCGTALRLDAEFCHKCGAQVRE